MKLKKPTLLTFEKQLTTFYEVIIQKPKLLNETLRNAILSR